MAVTVVGTPPAVGVSSQFTALAVGADNSTATVTTQAIWASSNQAVALVSQSGVVTGVKSGSVDITALFGGVTGKVSILVSPEAVYSVRGAVIDNTTGRAIDGATVDAGVGRVTTTNSTGQFTISGVPAGALTLTVTKSGYVTSTLSVTVGGDATVTVRLNAATPCGTIGFDEFQANQVFTVSSACGLTVRATTSNWTVLTSYGHPAPFIQFTSAAGTTVDGEVFVSANGTPFKFLSVDVYSSTTPIPYVITGFLNSVEVFRVQATQGNTFGGFATVTNPSSGASLDSLVIRLSNPAAACCSNPTGLDNIRVSF
jgi:carboxypeptidase family protein/Big-like domain-containing protein